VLVPPAIENISNIIHRREGGKNYDILFRVTDIEFAIDFKNTDTSIRNTLSLVLDAAVVSSAFAYARLL